MLRFGKYKGKTFEHVYRVDKSYCAWFVEYCKRGKDFKEYILTRGLFDRDSLVGKKTTASELAKKISMDPELRLFVANLWEEELDSMEDSQEEPQEEPQEEYNEEPVNLEVKKNNTTAKPKKNISPEMYGQFVDYFVRYKLSKSLDIDFRDRAIDSIIKNKLTGWEEVSKALDILNDPETTQTIAFHNLLKCASSHSVAFGGSKCRQRVMLELDRDIVLRTESFIVDSLNKCSNPIQNPNLSGRYISADADLIFGDTIVDIKTGKDDFVYYTIQLLIYAVLYRDLYGVEPKALLIFNPCIEDHSITLNLKDGVLDVFSDYLKNLKLL